MKCHSQIVGLLGLVVLHQSLAFTPQTLIRQKAAFPSQRQSSSSFSRLLAKKDDDDEAKTGMEEAFRQLESLDTLRDREAESTVKLDDQSKAQLKADASADPSLEEEVKLFKGMLQDSETDESELYSDVMKDMGGTPKDAPPPKKEEPEIWVQEQDSIPRSEEDTQKFMDQAIQEALEEAKSMTPDGISKKMSDSILDDEEIMAEIEEIFEKGNEKLLAGLQEIREEQQALAKISAEQRIKVAADQMEDQETKERLSAAEASMERQLTRVEQERLEVEKAVVDLERVKAELDAESSGSMFKPAALAGVLLFSVRAALDVVAFAGGGIDAESHLTAALIQGTIALICGAILFFLK